jgi:hypothetical protein
MQEAFMAALEAAPVGPAHSKVLACAERIRLQRVRPWDAKLSYKTAQQLKQKGVLP